MNSNRKTWIIFAAAAGLILALTVLAVFIIPGGIVLGRIFPEGIIPKSAGSLAANAPKPLENLFYVKDGKLYHTTLDTIAPKEIVSYDLPPQRRMIFAIRVSEDGRRFFYPDGIDNTKPNYCADIYCYDMTSKNPEVKKIDEDINNYTINQDGSNVFFLKDKALYVSDLSRTHKIADDIDKFFINKKGDRLVYLTPDGRLFHYTGKKAAKEIVSGITLQYVSADLSMIYYLKDKNLYLLEDGKDSRKIDSGVISVSSVYDNGSLYYLKTGFLKPFDFVNDDMAASDDGMKEPMESDYPDQKGYSEACKKYAEKKARDEIRRTLKDYAYRETKSLYFYSNGQPASISEYCDNVWIDEDHTVSWAPDSVVSCCGSDRPLLVYSQLTSDKINMSDVTGPADVLNHITNNVINNVDIYACSGSKALGRIGDEKPARVEYDAGNNKIYYAISPNEENPLLYDLYCVAIDGETAPEARKYAEGVNTGDILFAGNVVYIKSESYPSDGDLYVNNVKIDSFSNVRGRWTNSTNAFIYAGNISRYNHSFKLKLYKDGKVTKLADGITNYICNYYGKRIAYLAWKSRNGRTGQLYLYDGSQADRLIDTGVSAIIETLEPQYNSYWDDQPTYDVE